MLNHKFFRILITTLLVFFAFSCKDGKDEHDVIGILRTKYLIHDYLEPQSISIKEVPNNNNSGQLCAVFFDCKEKSKYYDQSSSDFKNIALQHGESGEKEFIYWGLPALYFRMPLNITKVKVLSKLDKTDISDRVSVVMNDVKGIILSGYETKKVAYPDVIDKFVSQLDNDNLLYITNPLLLKLDDDQYRDGIIVEITLSNGNVLRSEYQH